MLIITTGFTELNIPENLQAAEGYESVSTDSKDFEGKNVCFILKVILFCFILCNF